MTLLQHTIAQRYTQDRACTYHTPDRKQASQKCLRMAVKHEVSSTVPTRSCFIQGRLQQYCVTSPYGSFQRINACTNLCIVSSSTSMFFAHG